MISILAFFAISPNSMIRRLVYNCRSLHDAFGLRIPKSTQCCDTPVPSASNNYRRLRNETVEETRERSSAPGSEKRNRAITIHFFDGNSFRRVGRVRYIFPTLPTRTKFCFIRFPVILISYAVMNLDSVFSIGSNLEHKAILTN